jgi:thioesterase domain-containing protein
MNASSASSMAAVSIQLCSAAGRHNTAFVFVAWTRIYVRQADGRRGSHTHAHGTASGTQRAEPVAGSTAGPRRNERRANRLSAAAFTAAPIIYVRAAFERDRGDPLPFWQRIARHGLVVSHVACGHNDIIVEPNVQNVADVLDRCL